MTTAPNRKFLRGTLLYVACLAATGFLGISGARAQVTPRSRVSIDSDWRFTKGDPPDSPGGLQYDAAKAWILPTGNALRKDAGTAFQRPAGNLATGLSYLAAEFDDQVWAPVTLPHDYAIEGPFIPTGGGGMGRLPTPGVS